MQARRRGAALVGPVGRCLPVLTVLAALAVAPVALGHEAPRGRDLLVEGERIIINVNRGLLISTDGGARFDLHCGESFDVNSNEQAPMRLLSDGRLMLSTSSGVQRSSADYCDWNPSPTPDAGAVVLAAHPSEPQTSLVSTTTESPLQGVYRTTDDGDSFERIGELPQYAFFVGAMAYAPSDASRVYASTQGANAAADAVAHFLSASTDGGATFEHHPVAMDDDQSGIRLLGVHPTNPDVLFARLLGIPEAMRDDQLVVSEDGGLSFRVLTDVNEMRAFAIAADGSRLWVGGADGMWRSDDDGQSFDAVIEERTVSCLHHDGAQLWVCIDPPDQIGFAGLSRSDDGGDTLEPVVTFSDIEEPVVCPEASAVATMCGSAWLDWYDELIAPDASSADGGGLDADAAIGGDGSTADGGPAPPTGAGDDGCGCSVPGTGGHDAPVWLAASALFVLARMQRRRRANAGPSMYSNR